MVSVLILSQQQKSHERLEYPSINQLETEKKARHSRYLSNNIKLYL
ncbi:MAG: hypothetical protein ACI9FN_003281 [Saprospiraceae bacterium]